MSRVSLKYKEAGRGFGGGSIEGLGSRVGFGPRVWGFIGGLRDHKPYLVGPAPNP